LVDFRATDHSENELEKIAITAVLAAALALRAVQTYSPKAGCGGGANGSASGIGAIVSGSILR